MKRVALVVGLLCAAVATPVSVYYVEDIGKATGEVWGVCRPHLWTLWGGVVHNPGPVLIALGTFLATLGWYHWAKGKSLREAISTAATRVRVVTVPIAQEEPAVIKRARDKTTANQLAIDRVHKYNEISQIETEKRAAKLVLDDAELEMDYAELLLKEKKEVYDRALEKFQAIQKQEDSAKAEYADILVALASVST